MCKQDSIRRVVVCDSCSLVWACMQMDEKTSFCDKCKAKCIYRHAKYDGKLPIIPHRCGKCY